MPRRRLILIALLTAALAACAPTIQARGPLTVAPGLEVSEERLGDGADAPRRILFRTRDGLVLPGRAWLAGRPESVLVGLHGMNDYSHAFDGIARHLSAHGISVYAYDQRGFGEAPEPGIWAGTSTLAADAADFIAAVRGTARGRPLYVMGLSMGAAVVLATLGGEATPPVDGIVLVAPAVWGWSSLPVPYRAALWLGAHVFPGKTFTGSGLDIWPSDNVPMLKAYASDPLVIKKTRTDAIYGLVDLMEAGAEAAARIDLPALIVYGAKDQIIPAAPVRKLAQALAGSVRWGQYPDGYHMILRDLKRELVWTDIAAWLADREGPLPSGHERVPERRVAARAHLKEMQGEGLSAP